jgi:phosphopentomutase
VNDLLPEVPHIWHDNAMDFVTTIGAIEHLKKRQPRVMFIGLGETDEWAHARRYDLYLEAARKNDRFIRELWQTLQSIPQYAGKTTLIVTCDHGRGTVLTDWTNHTSKTVGAEKTWTAIIGPDTRPLGVRRDLSVTQSQIAATVAAAVGQDFTETSEKVARPLPGAVGE